jgi:hypothetical protein
MTATAAVPYEAIFVRALLDPQHAVPEGVTQARRFAVHRNNVVAGLIAALKSRFPAVEKIVGAEFFAAMARVFVARKPPSTPVLVSYGDEFADFIATFEPAAELAYLPDVARLEAARTRAYHAADVTPIGPDQFVRLDPHALADIRIALHPSVEIIRSAHPVVTVWAMNSGELELAPIADWRAEDALVVRAHLDVEVRALPPGGAPFLGALGASHTLGEAAEKASADNPAFDLSGNLAALIGWGLAAEIISS